MKHSLQLSLLVLLSGTAIPALGQSTAPEDREKPQIAIVAHRGFWNCEQAGYSENTVAALKAAQDAGLWGSEFDVHLTSDSVVVVNHDNTAFGKNIWTSTYEELSEGRFRNGESIPNLDSFLIQAEKSSTTVLVCEFKEQADDARNDLLVEKTVELLKQHNLFDPERVAFISFNLRVCKNIAEKYPGFTNQYLRGDVSPSDLHTLGIEGIDFPFSLFRDSQLCREAHTLKMSVNAWTVNSKEDILDMISQDVDAITTNEPLLVRSLVGIREKKN